MKTVSTDVFSPLFDRSSTLTVTAVCVTLFMSFLGNAHAIKDPDNQGRWDKPCEKGPDAVVPGFLINMGPTGARGILKERSFVVKYIFKKSPANGVLEIDDEVYGANGKRFSAHQQHPDLFRREHRQRFHLYRRRRRLD